MSGQGSPPQGRSFAATATRLCLRTVVLALMIVASATACSGEELEVRLRIAWGSGQPRRWIGSVSMPRGQLSRPRLLGLEADEPGSIYLEQGVLRIESASQRSYSGFDLTFRGPPDAEVAIDLRGRESLEAGYQLRVPLAELVKEVHSSRLDQRDNRVVVRRAPGDVLRIVQDRQHLVFEPGEAFTFQLQPHLAGLAANASYTVRLRLSPARKPEEVWSEEFRVTSDSQGNLPALEELTLQLPAQEGAYDLVATVHAWQFTSAIRRSKPTLQRKFQMVVIDGTAPAAPSQTHWNAAPFEIDPANPTWWDRLPRWSLTNIWPSFSQGPITSGKAARREHLKRTWIELPPEAWQAYPLGIGDPGRPHMLEIEYPSDVPQRLGISIVEPNAAGNVAPIGIDSGVEVTQESTYTVGKVVKHRIMFWPRSESPLVLLTNRSADQVALFGKIRVLNGPDGLAPLQLNLSEDRQTATGGRMLTAYFEKPLFPENFSATDGLDEGFSRSLDDWQTFYEGGRRLVEYLKHMGYNGAIISASCEGSTIYPSQLLSPTPRYDNGAFFTSGQDPQQKDVLEMLMRMFEREGLTLIPAMQFATPIPALETLRRKSNAEATGLEWIDSEGKTLREQRGTHEGLASYYNPLQPQVQQAMLAVVEELAERYKNHASYGGVALQVGPYSYARLPGAAWGFDDKTVAAYQAATGQTVAGKGPQRFSVRAHTLLGAQRQQWTTWRAAQMTSFYQRLSHTATVGNAKAKFYLADVNLMADPTIRHAIRPALPRRQSLDNTMVQQGIDLLALRKNPRMVLMRSRRHAPSDWATLNGSAIELSESEDIKRLYEGLRVAAALNYSEPDVLRLPAFDTASPFGEKNTLTRLVTQFSPSAALRRRDLIKTLAEGDKLLLSEGGWMLPLGQEDAVRDLFATYRSLPGETFETLDPEQVNGSTDGGLVIRRLQKGGKTYLYLLNNTPWPATAHLELAVADSTPLQSIGPRSVASLEKLTAWNSQWNVPLAGYDMVAAVFTADDVPITSRTLETDQRVTDKLRLLVKETGSRIKALQQDRPLKVLQNPGFEAPPLESQSVPDWVYSTPATRGGIVETNQAEPHTGGMSLRMENKGKIAWLRSMPIEPPTTGRIALLVWIRTTADGNEPRVRLSLDYEFAGERRYEFKAAGRGTKNPLRPGWSPYLANFDELPTEKVGDLRLGIDVMSRGTVWIDDVEVYDSRFEPIQRDQLTKIWALANFYLEQGRLGDSYHVLSGYWPRFLRERIEPPAEVAALPPRPAAAPEPPAPQPKQREQKSPSFLDRVKSYSPTKWNPFR